jgi:DNA-binding beta-propeller fold protein YncE
MVATPDGRYVWVLDRHGDTAEVFETATGAHVTTVALNGELTDNAAPDIAAISPSGDRIFVALRVPTPLSGEPHNARRAARRDRASSS